MDSVMRLELNDRHCLQLQICESALLCHHLMETKEDQKLKKLLMILLEIGEKRMRRKLSTVISPKPKQNKNRANWNRSSLYMNFKESHSRSYGGGRASIAFHPKYMKDKHRGIDCKEKRGSFGRLVMNYPLLNGDILLHRALRMKSVDVVIDLLCAQSDVDHRNDIGFSPLLTAIATPNNIECVVILIAAGAHLNDVDFERVKAFKHIGTQQLNLLRCVVKTEPNPNSNPNKKRAKTAIIATNQNWERRRISAPIQSSLPSSRQKRHRRLTKSKKDENEENEEISESVLLGKIVHQRIKNINKHKRSLSLYDRLQCALNVAMELMSDAQTQGEGQWNLLFRSLEAQKMDYHEHKALMRTVRNSHSIETTESVTEEHDDDEHDEDEHQQTETKPPPTTMQMGDVTLFPRLKLYEMHHIPAGQRFDAGFGTERERKGVRIIANTQNRLKYIQHANEYHQAAARNSHF